MEKGDLLIFGDNTSARIVGFIKINGVLSALLTDPDIRTRSVDYIRSLVHSGVWKLQPKYPVHKKAKRTGLVEYLCQGCAARPPYKCSWFWDDVSCAFCKEKRK